MSILSNAGDEGHARDRSSAPGSGGSPGVGNGNPWVFLPGEVHGQRSLTGCSPGSHKESDMTEWLSTHTGLAEGWAWRYCTAHSCALTSFQCSNFASCTSSRETFCVMELQAQACPFRKTFWLANLTLDYWTLYKWAKSSAAESLASGVQNNEVCWTTRALLLV